MRIIIIESKQKGIKKLLIKCHNPFAKLARVNEIRFGQFDYELRTYSKDIEGDEQGQNKSKDYRFLSRTMHIVFKY